LVRYGLVGAVWNIRVSSDGGVVVMGVADITVLHALRRGELDLSPSLEIKLSSFGDSSRMECSDGDPFWVMPLNTALELPPSGDKLKVLERSVMNSRSPEWMVDVLGELDAKQKMCVAGGNDGLT
jgi:hypothetical protein